MSVSIGFANALKSKFPIHDMKVLKFISTIFVRRRIKHINAVREKEKREKREAKAAAKKAKEEELSKPKFLTKAERAQMALERRQKEAEEKRKQMDELRAKQKQIFQQVFLF